MTTAVVAHVLQRFLECGCLVAGQGWTQLINVAFVQISQALAVGRRIVGRPAAAAFAARAVTAPQFCRVILETGIEGVVLRLLVGRQRQFFQQAWWQQTLHAASRRPRLP